MADHVRKQIREMVAAVLTGLTTTGARVFQSRVYPLETADLPGLLIYSESESSLPETINSPRVLDRVLRMSVVAVAQETVDLDDTLDLICKEVELALANPVAGLFPLARTITLTGTEIEMEGTAAQPVGRATMTYEVGYLTAENAPDVAL